jgi:hypothetical protein
VLMGILLLQRRARGYGDAWVTSRSRMDVRLTAKTGAAVFDIHVVNLISDMFESS